MRRATGSGFCAASDAGDCGCEPGTFVVSCCFVSCGLDSVCEAAVLPAAVFEPPFDLFFCADFCEDAIAASALRAAAFGPLDCRMGAVACRAGSVTGRFSAAWLHEQTTKAHPPTAAINVPLNIRLPNVNKM